MNVTDNFEPTEEDIRVWAYDEDLSFMQQDEDAILQQTIYVAIMLQIAEDKECPKGRFLYSILVSHLQTLFLCKLQEEIRLTREVIEKLIIRNEEGILWREKFLMFADLLENPRPITEEVAEKIGWQLCVGEYSLREFVQVEVNADGYIMYQGKYGAFSQSVWVNPEKGHWKSAQSKYQ